MLYCSTFGVVRFSRLLYSPIPPSFHPIYARPFNKIYGFFFADLYISSPDYSMLQGQNRESIGALLQPSNQKFDGYPKVGKDFEDWASTSALLRYHSKYSTNSLKLADRCNPHWPLFKVSAGNISAPNRESNKSSIKSSPTTPSKTKKNSPPGEKKYIDEKVTKRRASYHHILARDFDSTKHETEKVTKYTKSVDETGLVNRCGRCGEKIQSHHFHCNDCLNFRLCSECGDGGIYCEDDTHSWVEKSLRYFGSAPQVIGNISHREARTLYYGTKTFPSIFRPPSPNETPGTLFDEEHRFIRKTNPREILFYCDGACIRTSKSEPVAGWSFVYRPSAYTQNGILSHAGTISGRLETRGPTGKFHTATKNRAELRSAVAALQFIDWSKDCNRSWRSIVIATDSEYVICSVTKWISEWEYAEWKLEDKTDVINKDLWVLLLEEVRRYHSEGVKIAFWRVPRDWNLRAYEFARRATGRGYKERMETVIFNPDGPVKVRVTPFISK